MSTPECLPTPLPGLDAPALEGVASRRKFLKWSSTAGIALFAAACTERGSLLAPEDAALDRAEGGGYGRSEVVNLGRGDVAVLNYAYALEQLEAAFYTRVAHHSLGTAFTNRKEIAMLREIRAHEVTHREFLQSALGRNAIADLVFDFGAVDFESRESVLGTAATFEDLGVAAYNGAAPLIESTGYLEAAAKIVSVEARHASAIHHVLTHDGSAFAPSPFDGALAPQAVLQAAGAFIVTKIVANHLPSA